MLYQCKGEGGRREVSRGQSGELLKLTWRGPQHSWGIMQSLTTIYEKWRTFLLPFCCHKSKLDEDCFVYHHPWIWTNNCFSYMQNFLKINENIIMYKKKKKVASFKTNNAYFEFSLPSVLLLLSSQCSGRTQTNHCSNTRPK